MRSLPRLSLCLGVPLLLLAGCKRDAAPEAPEPTDTATVSTPTRAAPPEADTGPMALVNQAVARPYRDIPMLGLDGTPTTFGGIATAPVVFVVPWFTIGGSDMLHFAEQIQTLLADVPEAQVLVTSADRAVSAEDREVLTTLVREAGVSVPVWTDPELKLLAVINASHTGDRPPGNALWVAPLTAFGHGLETVETSHWDTDDLPALKEQLRAQVRRLTAVADQAGAATSAP